MANVEALVQLAVPRMCVMSTSLDAAVVAAALVEWALNTLVSIPAFLRVVFIQRLIVLADTGW